MRPKYLFIRILEACNANCFMCGFALSRDGYRFSLSDFDEILPQAQAIGVKYVRFTGGEPLVHPDIALLVRRGAEAGMRMSIITNGAALPKCLPALAEEGLAQVAVSVDGESAATHDQYRHTAGLFDLCMRGLALARELDVRTRVNTVVGPYNYVEMPGLQKKLTEMEVHQWELSAIKLERPIVYPDSGHVRAVCNPIYDVDPQRLLRPMGKRFFGNTPDEQEQFFERGIAPRSNSPCCHLVGDVVYIDGKKGVGFGCSLLPHRNAQESGGGVQMRTGDGWKLSSAEFDSHVEHFRSVGPQVCRGCSPSAAGYSNDVAAQSQIAPWHY